MNSLRALAEYGQSVWLDYIRRGLMTGGELARLVDEDGLSGVTSNPTIFEKTLSGSEDYDDALRGLLADDRHMDAQALYEALAIEDVRMAADTLGPLHDESGAADGFVSLEVSPHLAHDTSATVAEARRLWRSVDRANLMIKVPATAAGVPAFETLIAEGINVNVTLLFSLARYEAVAQAYLRGLERCSNPDRVASVASFFISRVDSAVDRDLERLGSGQAKALRGKIAVANAKRVFVRFRDIFQGQAFAALLGRGARAQRLLWASTGTKNPDYSDVLYVEELIGSDTVNTMSPATLSAFRERGRARPSLEEGLDDAEAAVAGLAELGVDLDHITERLETEGVAAFARSFDRLLAALDEKRRSFSTARVARQQLRLGEHQAGVETTLEAWQAAHLCRRLWDKDPTIWHAEPVPEISDRLGWLHLPETMREQIDEIEGFAEEVRRDGIRQVVLMGMGGSSLAPEVFAAAFGALAGYPELIVLDSTHPAAVRDVEGRIDQETLFLVASKSGTTIEPLSHFRVFWERATGRDGDPGRHFTAITDPGSALERLAHERGFRRTFLARPDLGGRYSALSVFGLLPAALIGIDVRRLLDRAWTMAEAGAFCVSESANPCFELGAALGGLARAGRDKVTFMTSPALAAFPAWLEQLIAESTGKDGKGIVPVADETPGAPEVYGADRFFVSFSLDGDGADDLAPRLEALEAAGHPVARFTLLEKADLAQEMFRWEVAVAVAGAELGIHPFNQPDVELAKELGRRAMASGTQSAATPDDDAEIAVSTAELRALAERLGTWLGAARRGDYMALQAYLAPTARTTAALQGIRLVLRERLKLATTLGYGPRFLHSTGQLHKGGPNTGLFLQLVDEPEDDIEVPETDYGFAALIRAQALGDFRALRQRGRRVLRLNLGRDVAGGLARIEEALG